jgi:hypothetical protein
MTSTRRTFLIMSIAGAATLAFNERVQAQAMVSETDPQAVALGYKADATKVDKAKFPKYAASQICGNCAALSRGCSSSWGMSIICW